MPQNPKSAYTIWTIEYTKEYAKQRMNAVAEGPAKVEAKKQADFYVEGIAFAMLEDPTT